ncbi:hypothetical protein Agub_g1464 [Astrephomene gubernaculifera]|uniref:RWP-RK domain-containing protein n=1 Tax=Astrephomene gubernaculifera TaxID=47775 RepID=A0AAD3HHR7_9CHLO|nr:hypothetical protein Agub_g1464 [Astrephomene gubernaculifera]
MESISAEPLLGEGSTEATNTCLDEPATDASGHFPLGEAPSMASAQPVSILTSESAPQAAIPIQSSCVAAALPCSQACDRPPLELPHVQALPIPDLHPALELPRRPYEPLPPARLVEVARTALQSAGLRLRQAPSIGQTAPQHEGVRAVAQPDRAAGVAVDMERSGTLKREHPPGGDNPDDTEGAPDKKRLHSEHAGGNRPLDGPVQQPCSADAVAHLAPVGIAPATAQPTHQPAVKREAGPLPPLAPTSTISPFARPPLNRLSFASTADGSTSEHFPAIAAVPLDSGTARINGAAAKPLSVDWQPGCTFTTGKRSARSPALKGGRNLSLTRAPSTEGATSPILRCASGLNPPSSAFAIQAASNAGAAGAVPSSVPTGTSAAAGAAVVPPAESGAPASAPPGQPWAVSASLETSASADLRRLAQLAEAAAMLEEQQVADGPVGSGKAAGLHCRIGAADDSGKGAGGAGASGMAGAVDGIEQPVLRPRSGSFVAGSGSIVSGNVGAGPFRDAGRPASLLPLASGPASSHSLRPTGSIQQRFLESQFGMGGAAARCRSFGREGSPDGIDADGTVGSPRSCHHPDSEAVSAGGSQEEGLLRGDGDEEGDQGDGSNDSAGGGSASGAGGFAGKSLTERYRAALKASAAQQRGRAAGGSSGSSRHDSERQSRTAVRNGVCARIASITKERLQQVYHLNIEEAARELGIGMTKLKEHCRTLGIPRWPSRKLKSMDKLIESLNERAMTEPATKEVIADILAEIESFKRAIYENPCLEVEEDIKRLRQSNFKKEYQQRQVEQRMRVGSVDRTVGGPTASGRAPSGSGSQLQQGGLREVTSGSLSAAAMAAAAAVAAGPAGALGQPGLPGSLPGSLAGTLPGSLTGSLAGTLPGGLPGSLPGGLPGNLPSLPSLPPGLPASFAAGLGSAFVAGQMAAAAPTAPAGSQLVQALSQAPTSQLPGAQLPLASSPHLPPQMPLLAPAQLQQLLMSQPSAATLQQLMTQRALGSLPPPAMLLPPVMPQPLQPQQLGKPVGTVAAVGDAAPEQE